MCLRLHEMRIVERKCIRFVVAGVNRRDTKNTRYRVGKLFSFLFIFFSISPYGAERLAGGRWPEGDPTEHVAMAMELPATIEG